MAGGDRRCNRSCFEDLFSAHRHFSFSIENAFDEANSQFKSRSDHGKRSNCRNFKIFQKQFESFPRKNLFSAVCETSLGRVSTAMESNVASSSALGKSSEIPRRGVNFRTFLFYADKSTQAPEEKASFDQDCKKGAQLVESLESKRFKYGERNLGKRKSCFCRTLE